MFLDAVEDCYKVVRANPYAYAKVNAPLFASMGYRRAPIKRFIMVYRVDDEEHKVVVQRFFFGGRNYEKLL
ncbi:MAG: type II toxin-antitoxin system RelE/ParE family toxin [Oscillospiraceae bacterium]|nr:type II toxin-antitoxin system RelE/ParE family toxin [Oscillospiraceae bacterium]